MNKPKGGSRRAAVKKAPNKTSASFGGSSRSGKKVPAMNSFETEGDNYRKKSSAKRGAAGKGKGGGGNG